MGKGGAGSLVGGGIGFMLGGPLGAGIGAGIGGSIGGGMDAQDSAAQQADAARDANATQLQMYNQTRSDLNPYREAGTATLGSLASGDFMKNWQQDPGYQFRLNEGMKAVQNSAAARGSLNSGATLKGLTRFGQDFASQEYGNIYNREFNRLSNLANLGQNSAAQTGAAGQNYANAYGQNTVGAANASAAATMGQNQATMGLLGQGAMAYGMYGGKSTVSPPPTTTNTMAGNSYLNTGAIA